MTKANVLYDLFLLNADSEAMMYTFGSTTKKLFGEFILVRNTPTKPRHDVKLTL
jgi:hypothetical protein